MVWYGTCSTLHDVAAKVVTCPGFTLSVDVTVFVSFAVTNSASNPTLNINGTGAKEIRYHQDSTNFAFAISPESLLRSGTHKLTYDGTYWILDVNTANPPYSIFDGDQISELFFNVCADISPYLPLLTYDHTTQGLDWCYIGFNYLCAADLSSVGLGNGYLLYWGESGIVPIYSTIAFDASALYSGLVVDTPGWQLDRITPSSTITANFAAINSLFLKIMDRVIAKTEIAFDCCTPDPKSGSTNPTTSTYGKVGQMYLNTTTQIMYVCTSTASSTYVWKPITFESAESQVG